MQINELKKKIDNLALGELYPDCALAKSRLCAVAEAHFRKFGEREELMLFSVPGRSEICGNHTDHNGGTVIAAAIDRDIIAAASPRSDGRITVQSEGRREDILTVEAATNPNNFPRFKSISLIAGVVAGFIRAGYRVGGFDAYTATEVMSGSGLSSSAAFEVMIGNILNHLYNGGRIDNREIAKIARFSENVYFGKPCGLMDQMATAVGGFVYIDFGNEEPIVEHIDFSLTDAGYALAIVGTGGSHSDLNDDFAQIPQEMKAVARALGKERMCEVLQSELYSALPKLRGRVSDRAILRAIHFLSECDRVGKMHAALLSGDMPEILAIHRESGHSSFEYLQNVFTTKHKDQGLSVAIAMSDRYLRPYAASVRVHGGGFEGTVQALVPLEIKDGYREYMDATFGRGACMLLGVRSRGAVRIM